MEDNSATLAQQQALGISKRTKSHSSASSHNSEGKSLRKVNRATNVQEALKMIGGFGRVQLFVTIVISLNMFRQAFFLYSLPYLEMVPAYTCTSADRPDPYECTPEDFCGNDSITATPDYSVESSLRNWVEDFDLACRSETEIGMLGSSLFVGIIISSLTMPRIADLYGRKWVILCLSSLQFLVTLLIF